MGDVELRTWRRWSENAADDVEGYFKRQCQICPTRTLAAIAAFLSRQQARRTLPKSDMRRIALEQAQRVLEMRRMEHVEAPWGSGD